MPKLYLASRGVIAEFGDVGGAIPVGFFQFWRRKVVAVGDVDVFEVRSEFDFFFTSESFDGASHFRG